MALTIPPATEAALESIEVEHQPTVDYDISQRLSGIHQTEGLTDPERKGAWAEATAFNFHEMDENTPWGTHYGPIFTATKPDGTPYYAPDIDEIDEEIINHWEERVDAAKHPVLRARYADVVWDLKKRAINKSPDVQFAQKAIDAYLDAITAKLYKNPPIHAAQAAQRALELALSIHDKSRLQRCKKVMLDLFDEALKPGHMGVWTSLFDALTESKKVDLTSEETIHLIDGLESMLASCATRGGTGFDPWGAERAARRLAAHYERKGEKEEVQRVIRTYGKAFEELAAEASPMLAMSWLQPVHDEYKNRGMNEDATRAQAASSEKGKNVASDLKQVRIPLELTEEQLEKLITDLTQGSLRDGLLRVTRELIPKTGKIKALLQELLTAAPLMARIGITRIVGDHFAAQIGSIEEDPEGRLIMQLAQHIEIYNLVLNRAFDELRRTAEFTTDAIVDVLYESPVFTTERKSLIQEGVQALLDGDCTKAVHVIIPQIEQALRQLLTLMGISTLKAGRNGTMQLKNLNDILREPAIKQALGEDVRLYLLTFLADERGQNIRNIVCHGLATTEQFNQGLANQTLHALLAVSLVRKKTPEEPAETVLLFQYGSNCDADRLNSPTRLNGTANNLSLAETIDEYDLAFDVWSKSNQCAASDLVPATGTGGHAMGVLYEVPVDRIRGERADGQKNMTQIEGDSYQETPIKVRTADGTIHDAITFLVKPEARRTGLATSSTYVGHIVNGLRAHQASTEYVQHVIEIAIATNRRADSSNEEEIRNIMNLSKSAND